MRVESRHKDDPEEGKRFSQFLKDIRNGNNLIKTKRGATYVKVYLYFKHYLKPYKNRFQNKCAFEARRN